MPSSDPVEAAVVFEALSDRPRPRLPRPADGVRFLTLDDAAARYKLPRQALLGEWLSTFSSLDLGSVEATNDIAPAPADGGPAGDDPSLPESASPGGQANPPTAAATEPSAGPRSEPITVAPIVLDLLRSQRFQKLDSDADLLQVIAFARIRGFDPFTELWADRRHDTFVGEERLIIGATIEGIRARADRSGVYVGSDEAEFEYDDDSDRRDNAIPPIAATATVYKIVGEHKGRFRARVRWAEYYGGIPGWQEKWPEAALALHKNVKLG